MPQPSKLEFLKLLSCSFVSKILRHGLGQSHPNSLPLVFVAVLCQGYSDMDWARSIRSRFLQLLLQSCAQDTKTCVGMEPSKFSFLPLMLSCARETKYGLGQSCPDSFLLLFRFCVRDTTTWAGSEPPNSLPFVFYCSFMPRILRLSWARAIRILFDQRFCSLVSRILRHGLGQSHVNSFLQLFVVVLFQGY